MSLSSVYLQHRLQLLERHVSTVLQMMKMRQPSDADDLADLERIWLAECEELHAGFMRGDSGYFEEREKQVSKRRNT